MKLPQAMMASPGPRNKKEVITLYLKGVLMGIADLIPGVSGGTIAFITGIYQQLIDAISSVNQEVLKDLLRGKIFHAIGRIHWKFLGVLLGGVFTSVIVFARLMHYLMEHHQVMTWGLFFGLILSSIFVLSKSIENIKLKSNIISIIGGALFAYVIVGLVPVETPETKFFIFICGVIAIMAMILPGISGSFLLLILGKYQYITGAIKAPFADESMMIIAVFGSGATIGIIGFSKLLKYVLAHYHQATMSFLTGVLIGSLRKIWPWKNTLETVVIRGKTKVLREENFLPEAMTSEVKYCLVLMLVGAVLVLALHFFSERKKRVN